MTVRRKRIYVCDSCGDEVCQEASDCIPPNWFYLNVQRTLHYGALHQDIPLRQASALRVMGDYCSANCLQKALKQGIDAFLKSVGDEIFKINSPKSSQNVNNIGDGS